MRVFNLDKKKYYKYMFLSAALWNFIVGGINLLLTIFMLPATAALLELEIPPTLFFIQGVLLFVIIIGIGLFIVSLDISKNHGIAQMIIFEKFLMFILGLVYFLIGEINYVLLLIVIVDLLYGILFLEFVLNVKKL